MEVINNLIIKIKNEINLKKLNYAQVAEISNIPLSTISKILSGNTKNPRLDTITAIAKSLDIEITNDNDIDLSRMQILHYRTSYKNTIVVYDNSGDKYEYNFDKKELEHILKVCEALTADYKKLDF